MIQANELAMTTSRKDLLERAKLYNMNLPANAPVDMVFNIAYGGNTTLLQLFTCLRDNLSEFDHAISSITPAFRENRPGDIPHSQASILKAQMILGYHPEYDALTGFHEACEWYWKNMQ